MKAKNLVYIDESSARIGSIQIDEHHANLESGQGHQSIVSSSTKSHTNTLLTVNSTFVEHGSSKEVGGIKRQISTDSLINVPILRSVTLNNLISNVNAIISSSTKGDDSKKYRRRKCVRLDTVTTSDILKLEKLTKKPSYDWLLGYVPLISWISWLFMGTLFYMFHDNFSFPIAFFMSVNVGCSIGWYLPFELPASYTQGPSLLFSSFHVCIGVVFVGVAVLYIAKTMVENKESWMMEELRKKQIAQAAETEGYLDDIVAALRYYVPKFKIVIIFVLFFIAGSIWLSESVDSWTFSNGVDCMFSSLTGAGYVMIPGGSDEWKFAMLGLLTAIGFPVMSIALGILVGVFMEAPEDKAIYEKIVADVTPAEVEFMKLFSIDDGDGTIDKKEFIILTVVRIGSISPMLVKKIHKRFKELDRRHIGKIYYSDIVEDYERPTRKLRLKDVMKNRKLRMGIVSMGSMNSNSKIYPDSTSWNEDSFKGSVSFDKPAKFKSVEEDVANEEKSVEVKQNLPNSSLQSENFPNSKTDQPQDFAIIRQDTANVYHFEDHSEVKTDNRYTPSPETINQGLLNTNTTGNMIAERIEVFHGRPILLAPVVLPQKSSPKQSPSQNAHKNRRSQHKHRKSRTDSPETLDLIHRTAEEFIVKLVSSQLDIVSDRERKHSSASIISPLTEELETKTNKFNASRMHLIRSITTGVEAQTTDVPMRKTKSDLFQVTNAAQRNQFLNKLKGKQDAETQQQMNARPSKKTDKGSKIMQKADLLTKMKRSASFRKTHKKNIYLVQILAFLHNPFVQCFVAWCAWIATGTIFYTFNQNITPAQGFFQCVSVGYGIFWTALKPSLATKLFTIFHLLSGSVAIAGAMAAFAQSLANSKSNWYEEEMNKKMLEEAQHTEGIWDDIVAYVKLYGPRLQIHFVFLLLTIVGVVWGIYAMDLTFPESLLFAVSAMTTGGLVDVPDEAPEWCYVFAGVYVCVGAPVMAISFGVLASELVSFGSSADIINEKINAPITKEELTMMHRFDIEDGSGSFDASEFVIMTLVRIGSLKPTLISLIIDRFNELDTIGAGSITYADLANYRKLRRSAIVSEIAKHEGGIMMGAGIHRTTVGQAGSGLRRMNLS